MTMRKPRRKPRHIEAQYQRAVIQWCGYLEREIPELRWLHAIPNGAHLSPLQAKLLKAEGVKAGVLDLFWPWPRPRHDARSKEPWDMWHGLYIEMKSPDGCLTDHQKEFCEFITGQSYCWVVARSPDEAMKAIKAYAAGEL